MSFASCKLLIDAQQAVQARVLYKIRGNGRVQLVATPFHASTLVDDQQALPQPGNKNQQCSKLRGIFRQKKSTALLSEQANSESAMANGTASMPELVSSDVIAADGAPSGVEPQAEVFGFTATGKPADQVRSLQPQACILTV